MGTLRVWVLVGAILVPGLGCGTGAGAGAVAVTDAAATDQNAEADAAANDDAANDSAQGDAVEGDTASADADAATSDAAPACTPSPRASAPQELGGARPAPVFLPKAWDGCTRYPLVILLHGYSASGGVQDAYLGFSARVDSQGFVLVVPEGTMAPNNNQFWNATDACCDFYGQKIDDVSYLRGLIDAAVKSLAVDPERVYLFGHSNGGFMAYRMACEASDVVTGITSLAGAVVGKASLCTPSRPVHVLQIHGTNDATIGYDGGALFPSAQQAVQRWRDLNACEGEPLAGGPFDYDSAVTGAETAEQRWKTCAQGVEVGLWTMKGSKHIPGINDAFRDAALKWLLAGRRTP